MTPRTFLFVLSSPRLLRYFDEAIAGLVAHGHEVKLAFIKGDAGNDDALGPYLDPVEPKVQVLGLAPPRSDRYTAIARMIRVTGDFVLYLSSDFRDAEHLRTRQRERANRNAPWTRLVRSRRTLPRPLVHFLLRAVRCLERALPSSLVVEAFIRDSAADVVVVSPLVMTASSQTDYVKAARALRIASVVAVASWDNLTTKGFLRETPDVVTVWNDAQRIEARDLHVFPLDRVVATGALPFDQWFDREPRVDRETFAAELDLDPDAPYVLFVGSTSNIVEEGVEERLVRSWIERLRAAPGGDAQSLGIVVRPHPERPWDWDLFPPGAFERVTIWPPADRVPATVAARDEYHASLYHAAAVVGVNTSAMIEAAVIGRPVLAIPGAEALRGQRKTIHFRHLVPEHGGFVAVSSSLDEHVAGVLAAVRVPDFMLTERTRFIGTFVRPLGVERSATAAFVDVLENVRVTRDRTDVPALFLRPLLIAATLRGTVRRMRESDA